MFRTVLVPLDGSQLAERALDVAAPIAAASGAELHLATVRRHIPRADRVSADVEKAYLERTANAIGQRIGQKVRPVMLVDVVAGRPMGEPPRRAVADVLEDYVRQVPVDLTVMTTHARGGLSRVYMGSVADAFIRYSPAPVLIFKPIEKRAAIAHIVVLLDGTPESASIIPAAIDLAHATSAKCTLLRIIQPGTNPYQAGRELAEFCVPFCAAGIPVQTDVRMSGNPAAAIIIYAITNAADALAMTTRTSNPIQRMFLGSVADTLLRKSGKPVLICNPFAEAIDSLASAAGEVAYGR